MPSPARALLVHEMAAPVLFQLSGAASFIRSHHLVVDGGYTLA